MQGFERGDAYYAGVLRLISCAACAHKTAWRYGMSEGVVAMLGKMYE